MIILPSKNGVPYLAISNIVVSSILGTSGSGNVFLLNLFPGYRHFVKKVLETQTTVITKSATLHPKNGNHKKWMPWRTVKRIRVKTSDGQKKTGLVNSYGLSNPGTEVCANEIKMSISNGFNVIPSFSPELSVPAETVCEDAHTAMHICEEVLGKLFHAIELDISCFNAGYHVISQDALDKAITVIRIIKNEYPEIKLIAKISYAHDFAFIKRLEEAGIDVIHSMNTFRFYDIFPKDKKSPIPEKFGSGAVSGEITFQKAFNHNEDLAHRIKVPIIFGCGINSFAHIRAYQALADREIRTGHSASICTWVKEDPREAARALEIFN